jgi:hypothetical protein
MCGVRLWVCRFGPTVTSHILDYVCAGTLNYSIGVRSWKMAVLTKWIMLLLALLLGTMAR